MKHEVLYGETGVLSAETVYHRIGPLRFPREIKQNWTFLEHLNPLLGSPFIVSFAHQKVPPFERFLKINEQVENNTVSDLSNQVPLPDEAVQLQLSRGKLWCFPWFLPFSSRVHHFLNPLNQSTGEGHVWETLLTTVSAEWPPRRATRDRSRLNLSSNRSTSAPLLKHKNFASSGFFATPFRDIPSKPPLV